MACGSCGQGVKLGPGAAAPYARGTGGRTLYRVVTRGGAGKVAFQTHDVALARKVRGNYPGAVIDPDPDAAPAVSPAVETPPAEVRADEAAEGLEQEPVLVEEGIGTTARKRR